MDRLKTALSSLLLVGCFVNTLQAQTLYSPADADEGILLRELDRPGVRDAFKPGIDVIGLPSYSDRAAWAEYFSKEDSVSLVRNAESKLNYQWQIIPATAYLDFERTGNRRTMEIPEGNNRGAMIALLLGELAEGKGRFIDQLINGAWQATQQPTWVLSAHQSSQDTHRALPDQRQPFIDLASGRYGSIMSLTWHFFHEEFDKVDPSISLAIERSVKRNILDPYLDNTQDRVHFWLGNNGKGSASYMVNNWNPWCNSDVLVAFSCMEKDQARLSAAVDKCVRSLDNFLDYIKKDGACEEGPGYWDAAAGKLFECLLLLNGMSSGAFDMSSNNRIRRFAEYISRAYVGNGYVVNFADAAARRNVQSEHTWIYGHTLGSRELENFALYCMADRRSGEFRQPGFFGNDCFRAVLNARYNSEIRSQVAELNRQVSVSSMQDVLNGLRKDVPQSTWYPETEMCFMRNSHGWFLGAKGGFNDESHNHNDIGTFVLYIRDIPVFVDAGVGTYTKFTFNNKYRYGIWTMQCDWHNLPMPNSIAQQHGRQYKSKNAACNLDKGQFSLGFEDAYPDSASILSYNRAYKLPGRGKPCLSIKDSFTLSKRTGADLEHFLVKGEVVLPGSEFNGVVVKNGELLICCTEGGSSVTVKMSFPNCLVPSVEEKKVEDRVLMSVWGESLKRITLRSSDNAPAKGSYSFTITEL